MAKSLLLASSKRCAISPSISRKSSHDFMLSSLGNTFSLRIIIDKKLLEFELALPLPHTMTDALGSNAVRRVAVRGATLVAPAGPVTRHDGLEAQSVSFLPPFSLVVMCRRGAAWLHCRLFFLTS